MKIFIFFLFRLNQCMYYSFNVSLLILLKTNRKIAFFDVFVTVLHMVFQRNLLLYSESFVQSKKYEEPEDLSACGFFHHVVPDLQFKILYCSVSSTLREDSNYNFWFADTIVQKVKMGPENGGQEARQTLQIREKC